MIGLADDRGVAGEVNRQGAERVRYTLVRPSRLDPERALALFEEMRSVAVSATKSEGESSWVASEWGQRWSRYLTSTCYLARSQSELIGFMWTNPASVGHWRVVHLQAAYVLPQFHGCGVGFSLNARMMFREVIWRLGFRTLLAADMASPIAFHGWRSRAKQARNFFPRLDERSGRPLRSELESVASLIAAALYPDLSFESRSGVLHSKTESRHPVSTSLTVAAVDGYFSRHVDAEAGDTALVVMRPTASELLLNIGSIALALPRMSRRRVAARSRPAGSRKRGGKS